MCQKTECSGTSNCWEGTLRLPLSWENFWLEECKITRLWVQGHIFLRNEWPWIGMNHYNHLFGCFKLCTLGASMQHVASPSQWLCHITYSALWISPSIYSAKNSEKKPHSSPVWARYGGVFSEFIVWTKFNFPPFILCSIWCYIWLIYQEFIGVFNKQIYCPQNYDVYHIIYSSVHARLICLSRTISQTFVSYESHCSDSLTVKSI